MLSLRWVRMINVYGEFFAVGDNNIKYDAFYDTYTQQMIVHNCPDFVKIIGYIPK